MRGRSSHRALTPSKPGAWHELDGGPRLAADRASVAESYPGLEVRLDATGQVRLEGDITLVAECGVPTRLAVRVELPADYPRSEPAAYDAGNHFPHVADRHFYPEGRCCLWLPPETRWAGKKPHALRAFLDELAVFLERQLIYDALPLGPNGQPPKWPWPERSHGVTGYIEWVLDVFGGSVELVVKLLPELAETSSIGRNYPCPCGSGLRFKRCHQSAVEEIRRKAGRTTVCRIFRSVLSGLEQGRGADPKM